MKLIIGTKNYSSWSLRPWILLTEKNIPFKEVLISLSPKNKFNKKVAKYSDAKRVPILIDDEINIWDSLSIIEYLHEKFPDKNIYPKNIKQRAYARSIIAEMHSGFSNIRSTLPMNIHFHIKNVKLNNQTQLEVNRVLSIWEYCLDKNKSKFLFGEFSAADAFFAPIVSRFITYNITVPKKCKAYMNRVVKLSSFKAWSKEAKKSEWLEHDEIYRIKK